MQIAEMKPRYLPFLISLTLLTWAPAAIASEDNPTGANPTGATDAFDLSIEDLMQVVVTSVSRKSQTLAQTAAAAYVIQADDIRRSGATNIPEALRLAPGVGLDDLNETTIADDAEHHPRGQSRAGDRQRKGQGREGQQVMSLV